MSFFKLKTTAFLFALISLLPVKDSLAGHVAGAEITYRHLSDSTYEFSMIFNRNCGGVAAPMTITLAYSSVNAGSSGTISLSRLPTTGVGVPSLSIDELFACAPSTACREEYVYRGNWTAPTKARDWKFSYSTCCLSGVSIDNTSFVAQYIESGLNNLDFPDTLSQNSSPLWHTRRPNFPGATTDTIVNFFEQFVCEGRSVVLDQSVQEYDGDAIKYEFMQTQTSSSASAAFTNGYTLANPIASYSGPVSIDSVTGLIAFTPGQPFSSGLYVVTIKATEYRNDTDLVGGVVTTVPKMIGYVTRDLFLTISDSSSCPDNGISFDDTAASGLGANEIIFDCPSLEIPINLTADVKCSSIDTNASCVEFLHQNTLTSIPLKSLNGDNCSPKKVTSKLLLELDSLVSSDTFLLVFKTGNDGNTLVTECFSELVAYEDTLVVIFDSKETGILLGDKLGPNNFDSVINLECGDTSLTVNISERAACTSLSTDGSDFQIVQNGAVVAQPVYASMNCLNNGEARSMVLNLGQIPPGTYYLKLISGNDGNTLLSKCGDIWPSDSIELIITGPEASLGPDIEFCIGEPFGTVLNPGDFYSYKWQNGDTNQLFGISDSGTYSVTVWNQFGCSDSDTINIIGKDCYLGISDKLSESSIKVFPNPFNNKVTLKGDFDGIREITVVDLSGKLVRNETVGSNQTEIEVDLSMVQSGTYILQLKGDSKILYEEVLIKRD